MRKSDSHSSEVQLSELLACAQPDVLSIQPLSARSSSSQFSFHRSQHHLLHQPVILHPAYVSKQIQFSFHDLLYDVLLTSYSSAHFFIRHATQQQKKGLVPKILHYSLKKSTYMHTWTEKEIGSIFCTLRITFYYY